MSCEMARREDATSGNRWPRSQTERGREGELTASRLIAKSGSG